MNLDNQLFAAALGKGDLENAVSAVPNEQLRPFLTEAVSRLDEATQGASFE